MRLTARDFVTYATYTCVIAGGLVVGFCLPRPRFSSGHAAQTQAMRDDLTPPLYDSDLGASGLEPAPLAMDGAESPELHALRQVERRMLNDAAPGKTPKTPNDTSPQNSITGPDSCADGAACAEDPSADYLAGLRMPDLPVHADRKVKSFLQYFTQEPQGRQVFRGWLKRSGRYRGIVETALREHALPRDLIALVFIESGFSPFAVSQAGAVGLWQFMPETGRAYGLSVEGDYDERRSVARSTEAATRHLSDLYEKFGSWELALAAYNMGYKGMLDRVRDTGSNDFWTLAKIKGALPEESVLYVPKILAVAILINNLEKFGFDDTHVEPPVATANLEVPAGLDLRTLARATGTSVHRLRELNPELLTDQIPDRGRVFVAHVPSSGVARAHAMLPRLLDQRERDGLEQEVGRSFDWGRDELPRRGARSDSDDLLDGPRVARQPAAKFWPLDDERADNNDTREGRGRHTVFYRVGDHETLQDVAKTFGVTAQEIVEANYLDPGAKLQPGMLLSLSVRSDVMGRMARKRAAARLPKEDDGDGDAPGPRADKDEPDVMRGYAIRREAK